MEVSSKFDKKKVKRKLREESLGDDQVEVVMPDLGHSLISKQQQLERKTKIKMSKKRKKEIQQLLEDTMRVDHYPGDAPIAKEALQKFDTGSIGDSFAKSQAGRWRLTDLKKKKTFSQKQAARSEVRHLEEEGFIWMDAGKGSSELHQSDIAASVDIQSAAKRFDLKFEDYGPYRIDFTRNGRFLLFGSRRGHVASLDWILKQVMSEMNVMETVQDVKWFHNENYYAIAQKRWTYVYDNMGTEIHCLKSLDCVLRMEFLPYSFLLACAHAKGFLSFLDVSTGQLKVGHSTHRGYLDVMAQNPATGAIHLGHAGGTVTLWSPTVKEPLVEILCHGTSVTAVAVDIKGRYMATSSVDRRLKIWDLRTYRMLQSYKVAKGATALTFSQTGLVAAGIRGSVQVFKDCCEKTVTEPYLVHRLPTSVKVPENSVSDLQFVPFEDVLGIGHGAGFSSMLVPGAGEANFDALEANPYSTKRQRQHGEVKMLLDKVPIELVADSGIHRVDTQRMKSQEENKPFFLKRLDLSKSRPKKNQPQSVLDRFKKPGRH